VVLITGSVLVSTPVRAQGRTLGSRYLPVDHWAYEYLQRLTARGYLPGLNPLVQPYRRLEVARGLAGLAPDTLRRPVADWVRMLRRELARELELLAAPAPGAFGFEVAGGARASTSRRLDPTRPLDDGSVWPNYRVAGWFETGPVAAETRAYGDFYFRDDPDGGDPGYDPRTFRGGRTDNAYLSVLFPFGSVDIGVLKRNWGLIGTPGMTLSDGPTPYPQLGLELRLGRVTLRSLAAQLDTLYGLRRQFVAHRLDYRHGDLAVSLGETQLYVYPTLLIRFLNPVDLLVLNADDDPDQNNALTGQVWWRRGAAVFYFDGMLDDIDANPGPVAEPPQYAFTVGARVTSLAPWAEGGVQYQQVGAWSYRTTPNEVGRYSHYGRGLGANYSDYDRLAVWADLYPPLSGLRITPRAVIQRQGEGDFRDPFPGGSYRGQPALFLGVVERTIRLALAGRYQPAPYAWLAWDVGPNFVRNKNHVSNARATDFGATVELGIRLMLP